MSIIIKGMDMPKDGESIIMVLEHSGKAISRLLWDGGTKAKALDDTQVISIPTPHGRLIDADKARAEFREWTEDEWNKQASPVSWAYAYEDVIDYLDDAPTILEAEENR